MSLTNIIKKKGGASTVCPVGHLIELSKVPIIFRWQLLFDFFELTK